MTIGGDRVMEKKRMERASSLSQSDCSTLQLQMESEPVLIVTAARWMEDFSKRSAGENSQVNTAGHLPLYNLVS